MGTRLSLPPLKGTATPGKRMAWTLAETAAVPVGQSLSQEEMSSMVDDLLSLKTPAYTPEGKSVFIIISYDELQKRFN